MRGLPDGWTEAPIGDLCDLINGRAFRPSDWSTDGLPIVRIQNLNNPEAGFNHFSGEVRHQFLINTGQLLFAWSGTPGTSFGAHIWRGGRGVLNQHIFRVEFSEAALNKSYLRFAINQKLDELMDKAHGGVGLRHVTKGKFEETVLPLPPLAEQQRIVAKLDALTARTARARADLDRVPILAEQQKRALLARAISGELTSEWRRGRDLLPIELVLTTIREGRSSDRRLSRRSRPSAEPAFVLPPSWAWVSPDEIADDERYSIGIGPFGSNLVKADYQASGVRLIFVRDIRRERFDADGARYVTQEKAAELHQHTVTGGEVLITKMGEPPGDTALYPPDAGLAVITADCVKLKPDARLASPRFLAFAIRADLVKTQLAEITAGVAQQKISLERFRDIALPVPPLEEQHEIVRRIVRAFAEIDRLVAEAAAARRLLDRLDQAVLAKAFRGELVPQDPTDEPASVLLERIRADRAAAPAKAKRGRKPKAA